MMAFYPQESVAHGDLDDRRDVPTGSHRNLNQRKADVEKGVSQLFDAEAVVLHRRVPVVQFDDDLDLFLLANCGYTEQVADVDDAEAANLHVKFYDLRAFPDERGRRLFLYLDDIVGDESMAAQHEVEGAFALSDAAFSDQKNPDAEDIR